MLGPPSLEVVKEHGDVALRAVGIGMVGLSAGVGLGISEVISHLTDSRIL